MEELDGNETTPFDECIQMSVFDLEKKTEDKKNDNLSKISRKELFDKFPGTLI